MYVYCIAKLSIKTFIHMLWLQLAREWYTGWHIDVFQPYEGWHIKQAIKQEDSLFAWYVNPYMAETSKCQPVYHSTANCNVYGIWLSAIHTIK